MLSHLDLLCYMFLITCFHFFCLFVYLTVLGFLHDKSSEVSQWFLFCIKVSNSASASIPV